MEEKRRPIILIIEDIKAQIATAINAGVSNGIPAFLLEGVLCEYLSELRKVKNDELLSIIEQMNKKESNEVNTDG